jgi:hypothetical protein
LGVERHTERNILCIHTANVSRFHRVRGSVCFARVYNLATSRRGGHLLWNWPLTEFCEMVLRAAWTAIGVRRTVPANQSLDDKFFR